MEIISVVKYDKLKNKSFKKIKVLKYVKNFSCEILKTISINSSNITPT